MVVEMSMEMLPLGHDGLVKAGKPGGGELRVIEWDHMNLKLFYPLALTSTWTVRTALYPLAVLRSRLQLQKQHTVYRNTFHAFTSIARVEGIRGLYRGFWVTFPQIGTSFIYSTVYEWLRASLQNEHGIRSTAVISSLAGGAASFCSQVIFVPTDIIAQYMMVYHYADKFISGNDRAIIDRLRAEQELTNKRTLGLRVVRAIYRNDGISGFFRGFWASSSIYVPYCMIFWSVYYYYQDVLKKIRGEKSMLLVDQGIAAGLSGLTGTLCTNPMEMFRIRIQVHRSSYRETAERMIRNEGWHVFTKGLGPRFLSNGIYSVAVMTGYEFVKRLCVIEEYKGSVKW